MAIKRLSSSNPYNQTLEDTDENIQELNGKIDIASFEKNEIDAIYDDFGLSRKFIITSGAGHSSATYVNWLHVNAESGYSIWSIPFTNFKNNSINEMYFDNKILIYKGQADQESYSSFDTVFLYDGSSYVTNTTEAASEGGTAFSIMDATNEYLYIGSNGTFAAADFDFNIKGSNYTLIIEYFNGSSWVTMTSNVNSLDDNTNNFKSDGRIEWTVPSNWQATLINSVSKYWIRISTSTIPVTTATIYSIFPGSSVYSLLQLSSTNALNEEWSWCYFNNKIYVTIRNSGNSNYEGNKFITSSSSATNKENYFVYNHTYKVSYEKTNYSTGAAYTPQYGFRWYTTGSGGINIINANGTVTPFTLTNTSATALAFRLNAGTNDTTTGASIGTGGAAPLQITKYLALSIDGTTYKIALYSN